MPSHHHHNRGEEGDGEGCGDEEESNGNGDDDGDEEEFDDGGAAEGDNDHPLIDLSFCPRTGTLSVKARLSEAQLLTVRATIAAPKGNPFATEGTLNFKFCFLSEAPLGSNYAITIDWNPPLFAREVNTEPLFALFTP